ncbi:MAG TPA: branched-chain amino acid aminotransferase [Candidatus Stercoripulliclostridium merdipullorum]|uniref:Branched-chain-amino-acid aminotransferase n=1 Tax=Candidatus Stercoripulliclostridium merdipullorum TaxID=2840952 RepID=A0A9D1NC00_9FIRM|nr:branched-chain amino acid aminotransferase [Candidatus Stercoripulliclostridium merdipullorum]
MKITKTQHPKQKPDFSKLGFGKYFTDHMLVMDYENGAWKEPEIVPYAPFEMDPSTTVLHYGQGIFEGLKAYKNAEGKITLFRPRDNLIRMNNSARRLCMPELDVDSMLQAMKELVLLEQDWIPTEPGTALYLRPTMVGTAAELGVHPSSKYRFYIILSPVGAYYATGLKPTRILIEEHFVRAPLGGTGEAKCMGNYAASLLAGNVAKEKGYEQVLWLDAKEHKYVEEVGAMNMFFVIDGVVKTPALVGSILPGITRNSVLQILRKEGMPCEETRVSVDEIVKAYEEGRLTEAFGSGTAAVISPVGVLGYQGKDLVINGNEMGPITSYLYDKLTGIQYGREKDEYGWIVALN